MTARKSLARRAVARNKAKALLEALAWGEVECYEGYRQLYGLWCSQNSAVQELRALFRIQGFEPDGRLSVTDDFRCQIMEKATALLSTFEI